MKEQLIYCKEKEMFSGALTAVDTTPLICCPQSQVFVHFTRQNSKVF